MNEQLIKFIELCLMDGVLTDKEREVIFRKSNELGVPEDECEIILDGMIQQKGREVQSKEVPIMNNISVSNSFEEKKLKLIKRKILNKQIELESLISNNNNQLKKIEKQKKELEEKFNQCLNFEIIKKEFILQKKIESNKSHNDILKISKSVKIKIEKL